MTQTASSTYWSQIKGMAEQVPSSVTAAIASASKSTGVNFSYLLTKAEQESSLNANAKASSSSATGLFQFVSQTWLDMVDKYGSKYGLSNLQKYIHHSADGSAKVSDPEIRRQILALRTNPQLSSDMAAELTKSNGDYLQQHTGGKIGNTELYLAHFLGAAGASQFINAKASSPGQSAASVLPEAAASNRSVFYSASGRPLSLQQVYDRFAVKFDGTGSAIQLASASANEGAVPGSTAPAVTAALPGANDLSGSYAFGQSGVLAAQGLSGLATAGTQTASAAPVSPLLAAPSRNLATNLAAQTFGDTGNMLGFAKLASDNAALWLADMHSTAHNETDEEDDGADAVTGSRKSRLAGEPAMHPNSAWLTTMMTSPMA